MTHSSSPILRLVLMAMALAWGLVPGSASRVREALRNDLRNRADYERMERGYYEQLLDEGRQIGEPAARHDVPFEAGPMTRTVADLREYVLKSNLAEEHWGVRWSTNAFGMRDRDYALAKPAKTSRIAFVGDSIGAGWGVGDGLGFEPTVERALDVRSRASGGPAVEVLNFAVPGHAPGQRWDHFTRVGWSFGPDLVLYEATPADPGWDERRLRGLLPRGIGWDSPLFRDALAKSGVRPGGDFESYKRGLRPVRWEVLANVYRTIAGDCRSRGVPSVWVLIPRVGKSIEPGERDRLVNLARRSGFTTVLDLSDTYDGIDPRALAIGPADFHPNADGHARLARRLEASLIARPELRRLLSGPVAGADAR